MGENSVDAGAVVHGEVKTDDRSIAPADYCYAGDVKMVQDGDCVASEIVVVELGEIYEGAAPFAAGAGIHELSCIGFRSRGGDILLKNDLSGFS